jgi:predicted RecA/RadA family phage recombinase
MLIHDPLGGYDYKAGYAEVLDYVRLPYTLSTTNITENINARSNICYWKGTINHTDVTAVDLIEDVKVIQGFPSKCKLQEIFIDNTEVWDDGAGPMTACTVSAGWTLDTNYSWALQGSAADINWCDVTYGNGMYVAVADDGIINSVMSSPNGINWTIRAAAAANSWKAVTYGNGLFVAVADTGIGNRVMTSPNGINWTIRVSAADKLWTSVTYGNGLFVAVSQTAPSDQVMTSPDGINWTSRTVANNSRWMSVTYGNGLFVAVCWDDYAGQIMTSPDGITWTTRTSPVDNRWWAVTYGNGMFVATSVTGIGNRVMTSPDGINWTPRISAVDNEWESVTYGNGLFVAVATGFGVGNRVMTSPNGINWTIRVSAADNAWMSVTYGNGLFVAVSRTGVGNRVMTMSIANYNDLIQTEDILGAVTQIGDVAGELNYTAVQNGIRSQWSDDTDLYLRFIADQNLSTLTTGKMIIYITYQAF